MHLTLADVVAAKNRIAEGIYLSPCPESIPLSGICRARVYCKLDYLQRTGSFKERGARNALLLLDAEKQRRGVISASAGNHALGLAYHGKLLGIGVTVVMPRYAPLIKRTTCRALGAEIILHGETFGEAYEHARQLADSQGLVYIHGFDDPAIIAGQGTIGLEILEQVPDVEAIVVPIGGGGLMAGVALAVKSRHAPGAAGGRRAIAGGWVRCIALGRQGCESAGRTDACRWVGRGPDRRTGVRDRPLTGRASGHGQ